MLDLLDAVLVCLCSWRIYVCVIPAALLAFWLHQAFPDAMWPWFISVPAVIGAVIVGLSWDVRANSR
ncbi:hypothetical protein ASA1KI_27070 [Opitutales bacterium ASA1]|uniref:hypothetical protein n=1 Tax=Congregicoccus parvus TaxID=3081749 RepID=UPI002B2C24BD|nr:hypothetical protein ASA1KI_27070 [Opitutales bacterium ASA1]